MCVCARRWNSKHQFYLTCSSAQRYGPDPGHGGTVEAQQSVTASSLSGSPRGGVAWQSPCQQSPSVSQYTDKAAHRTAK